MERGFLLQLRSHAADHPLMTAGKRWGGPWVSDKSAGRARFPFTIKQSCSRPASDRCRRGQPLEATHEVRGRARFPSTTTQSRSRPATDNYKGGLPLESTNEVRGRARFPFTTIQSRSRPASGECRGARGGTLGEQYLRSPAFNTDFKLGRGGGRGPDASRL